MKAILKRMLSGVLSTVMAVSAVPTFPVNAEESAVNYPHTMVDTSNGTIFECGDYQIRYNILSEWDNYKQVEMEIINPTDETMYNWAFMFNAGGHIENIWNASIVDNQNCNYVLSCDNNNNVIEAHSSQLMGYIICCDQTEMNDIVFKNCIEKIVCFEGFELSAERNNSDNTYSLSLKNTSDIDFYGWEINFDTNAEITNIWNAQLIDKTENSFKLKSENYRLFCTVGR